MTKNRPRIISLLAYLNILEAVLCGLFYLFVIIYSGIDAIFDISMNSRFLLLIYSFLPAIISYGLLKGKRWGWLGEVFLFTLIMLQFILEIFYLIFDNSIKAIDGINWISPFLGLVISFFVIKYLFSKSVRSYFEVCSEA